MQEFELDVSCGEMRNGICSVRDISRGAKGESDGEICVEIKLKNCSLCCVKTCGFGSRMSYMIVVLCRMRGFSRHAVDGSCW